MPAPGLDKFESQNGKLWNSVYREAIRLSIRSIHERNHFAYHVS